MFKEKIVTILMLVLLPLVYSCEGGKMREETVPQKNDVAVQKALEKVAEQRIFFGHQSVGYNIMDGLKDIAKEYPEQHLKIADAADPARLDGKPIFLHSEVGQNTDPVSKLNDFSKLLDHGIGSKVDIAFVKFCYVDFTQETDTQKLFDSYKAVHKSLKKKYPKITFVHVTAPLTSKQTDVMTLTKNVVKYIIGRPVRSYKDNISRNQFNDMLTKEYAGKEPIFDLALIESTLPDGKRVVNSREGKNFFSLAPEYTSDGGHLNEKGRRIVAIKLLEFLAGLPASTSAH
jgi:hypothetical protein